jgi:ABC-type dipeptide/oligopeptide/nickel transport systems, permease components
MVKNPFSLHIDPSMFEPANPEEKKELIIQRQSLSFWQDAWKRLRKNPTAMIGLTMIILSLLFAFVGPTIVPYKYDEQIRGFENLSPMQSPQERDDAKNAVPEPTNRSSEFAYNFDTSPSGETTVQAQAAVGYKEAIFPHVLGTDNLGRDNLVRIMYGSRISLMVGIIASVIILIIGSTYGSFSGFIGGRTDNIMMRILELLYAIPDILIVILLSIVLKEPLAQLFATRPEMSRFTGIGPGLLSMFITFALLYWVSMARIVRGQVLQLKEQEFITAAQALGANNNRVIFKHLLPNCIGPIIVTTTFQIPNAIFVESFLSFIGLGISAPMASLGSLANDAMSGIQTYPYMLAQPAIMIAIIILAFNMLGDGLRDALDPRMKK